MNNFQLLTINFYCFFVTTLCRCVRAQVQVCRQSELRSLVPEGGTKRAYTHIGLYRGNVVAIKPVHKRSLDITRSIRKDLKQVRRHNIFRINLFRAYCSIIVYYYDVMDHFTVTLWWNSQCLHVGS